MICAIMSKSSGNAGFQADFRVWRSLVSRLNGVQEALSSNLSTRTKSSQVSTCDGFFYVISTPTPMASFFRSGRRLAAGEEKSKRPCCRFVFFRSEQPIIGSLLLFFCLKCFSGRDICSPVFDFGMWVSAPSSSIFVEVRKNTNRWITMNFLPFFHRTTTEKSRLLY